MSRKWKSKGNDVSVSFDSSKKVVYVGGEFIQVEKNTADTATVTNSQGESTQVSLALEFTGSKGSPNDRLATLERNITILADALMAGNSGGTSLQSFTVNGFTFRGDGSDLAISYNGTDVFKVTTSGAVIARNDVTAFGAP